MKDLFDLYKLEKERNGLYKENGSNVKLELYIKQNYISKDKIREILNIHKETPLEQGYLFYEDIKKLLEEHE